MVFRKPKPLPRKTNNKLQYTEVDAVLYPEQKEKLSPSLQENESALQDILRNCSDIVFRPLQIDSQTQLLFVYVDGMIDVKLLDQFRLTPFLSDDEAHDGLHHRSIDRMLNEQIIPLGKTQVVETIQQVVEGVLAANAAILIEHDDKAILADLKYFTARSVEEPASEITIRGSREGFTEVIRVNTSMLRRRIKSPRLKMESLVVGELTRTDVVIAYVEGLVNQNVLKEVRARIRDIQIDGILESGYIEEFITDAPFSPFPVIQNTERPDIVTANLLEGKVAILVDGTPFVLIAPFTFWSGLQAAEDYYENPIYTTMIRWIRMIAFNVTLFFPSLYVAVVTFHPQMIPTNLLLSFVAAREPTPFPTAVEALIMELMFEGLREAGIRLPKAVGSAVSIVGALVIGQAAVEAGIVSAPIVIVVATTGIASFVIPRYNLGIAYRLIRFPMLFLAGIWGFYGVSIGILTIIVHLISLRSFGVPYLTPVSPQNIDALKDVFFRVPRWNMISRPEIIHGDDSIRTPVGQQPSVKRKRRK